MSPKFAIEQQPSAQILEIKEMKCFVFPEFRIIDNKTVFSANLDEHSKDGYFTVKGFQIIKICNKVELGKFVSLTKNMSVLSDP